MRQPIRPNKLQASTASSKSFPAPVGGWNAKASLAEMKENEAVVLENYFPEASYCRLRGGHIEYATGLGTGVVDSLINYTGLTTQKLFAAANNKIYDVTLSGSATVAVSGLLNNRWEYENYGNASGNYVFCVNGADTPRQYNGTAWSTMTLTGPTPANLAVIKSYKERLFMAEKNSLAFWYLPVSTISGAMTKFDIAPYATKGGSINAIATWSRDAGNGPDDYIAFITTEGEVITYTGTDPSSATDWRLVSIYYMPAPISRRCHFRVGSDLILVTQSGFVPLSKVILTGLNVNSAAISDKIEPVVNIAFQSYGTNFGWEGIFYPKENMGIFNVPVAEGAEQVQFVVNTQTGAWCRFAGLNANCWAVFNDNLYFGGNDGKVYAALTGTEDNGSNILGTGFGAFSYMNTRGRRKKFNLVRPVFRSTGNLKVATKLNVDFSDALPDYPDNSAESVGTDWDLGDWDVSTWGGDFQVSKSWRSITGSGLCAALAIRTSTRYQEIHWLSTDYSYEIGGII